MGIIVSNGDSFTYGDELLGSRNPLGFEFDTHHQYTYTHILAEMLEKKYVNLAKNGASNSKIFRTTMNFLQSTSKDIDLLVITWSSWGRFEIANSFQLDGDKKIFIPFEDNMNSIIPSHRSDRFVWDTKNTEQEERAKILEAYVNNVLTMQTQIVHGLSYMRTVQHFCDILGIKVMQGINHRGSHYNMLHTLKNTKGWENYAEYVQESMQYLRPECKIGLGHYIDIYSLHEHVEGGETRPMGHVCEKTQKAYAEMLYKIVNDKGWFGVIN
jgi:hypothetical protein